jgi:flagellar biosynthesis/type III secretory pathway protein FliH
MTSYRQLDEEIRVVVRGQNNVEREGKEALEEARSVITQLANRILEIKEQAKQSEQIVRIINELVQQIINNTNLLFDSSKLFFY